MKDNTVSLISATYDYYDANFDNLCFMNSTLYVDLIILYYASYDNIPLIMSKHKNCCIHIM